MSTQENSKPAPHLNATQVAEWLNLSRSMVYKLAELGTLKCMRHGSTLRFDPLDVRAYVESLKHKSPLSPGVVLPFRPGE